MKSIQFMLTPAAGKQVIALALSKNPLILKALQHHTIVVTAGTTNGYIAKALLEQIGETFAGKHFFRGIVSGAPVPQDLPPFEGDVVIEKGCFVRGKTIQEVAPNLTAGDIILKGANAVDLKTSETAVLIGHPEGGTLAAITQASIGRRVRVISPVGVEKRVDGTIHQLCRLCNAAEASGVRLAYSPGVAFTELDALHELSGAVVHLIAAGGVCGYEGSAWFQCEGTEEQLERLAKIVQQVKDTPPYQF